ncbi:MAG: apolipoprotein acyltransferase [Aestuariivita sp.]|nr:apolipoprotein acyltransferase [Aestuariivita sp.]MCY4202185.1 apolipoprotein acyltransferase [Aestuariivita sp.]MCY4289803.1 apolipoprotein acyltransferase [Aestuariivita sp.]MCY4347431.1 apolipoprotein acyltransferase [Aestuariivita sp.]
MITVVGALLGAILGYLAAKRQDGDSLDLLQYTIAYAIAFALLGLLITIILHRTFL